MNDALLAVQGTEPYLHFPGGGCVTGNEELRLFFFFVSELRLLSPAL